MKLASFTRALTRRSLQAAMRPLRSGRCTLLLLLTVLCLVVREEFPFSDFPMYSSFGENTYYVYLADGDDKPLATPAVTGVATPILKKVYQTELEKEIRRLRSSRNKLTAEQKRPAGERVLAALADSLWAQQRGAAYPASVRLYEVNIALDGTQFAKRTVLIAQRP